MTESPEILASRLYSELAERGEVSGWWLGALHAVPRHHYIPDTIYPGSRDFIPLHRAEKPEEWLKFVYTDDAITTQVDNGHPNGTPRRPTSACSQPLVVAQMLEAFDPKPGERVLEIGTGTGWNAAILANEVGAENVTTIEVDQSVSDQARGALDAGGYQRVTTVVGDGTLGWKPGAPYAGVLATVAVKAIPYAWVEQTRPGGRIVGTLSNAYFPPGIVALNRDYEGNARGRIVGRAAFMSIRADQHDCGPYNTDTYDCTETKIHPYYLGVNSRHSAIAIGQRVPDVRVKWHPSNDPDQPDLSGHMWWFAEYGGSWASLRVEGDPPWEVHQSGPRRLFEEVRDAYRWWRKQGEPQASDWLVTVTPEGQTITLQPE